MLGKLLRINKKEAKCLSFFVFMTLMTNSLLYNNFVFFCVQEAG